MELILASRNAHKVAEVTRMLGPFGLSVVALPDRVELPPEDGATFEANAMGKAIAAAEQLRVPVIADDSGIESDALDGRPGVRSARFAGEHASDAENLAKLMVEAPVGSTLRYVCALALVVPAPPVVGASPGSMAYFFGSAPLAVPVREPAVSEVFFGDCTGTLAGVTAGDGGFGYDPAFIPDEYPGGRTMAQLTPAEKDAISHRGRAVRAFGEWYGLRAG